jgi:hypothetical protein
VENTKLTEHSVKTDWMMLDLLLTLCLIFSTNLLLLWSTPIVKDLDSALWMG